MVSIKVAVKKYRHSAVKRLFERKYKKVGLTIVKDNIPIKNEVYSCKMIIAGDDPKDLKRFEREARRLGYIAKGEL